MSPVLAWPLGQRAKNGGVSVRDTRAHKTPRVGTEPGPDPHPGSAAAQDNVDVVYVAGDGRSGSTLLSRILGQMPGWFSAGEVRYVWERGLLDNRLCECGLRFRSCPLWTQVMERLDPAGAISGSELKRLVAAEHRLLRTRFAPAALRGARRPTGFRDREPEYADRVSALYAGIRSATGCSVVVDSSKLGAYGLVLRGDPSLRVAVVHLVRDPRASAYSWRRLKPLHDANATTHMRRRSLVHSCAVWTSGNQLVESLLRRQGTTYVRIRYEDLVARPEQTLRTLTRALGHGDVELPVERGGFFRFDPGHAMAGNPDRHSAGPVALRLDDEWRRAMPRHEQRLVHTLTRPVSTRYGYVL
jgi:hypothetical protein